jgi:hypothetical protein
MMERPPRMGDPVALHTSASQSYQVYGTSTMVQYQAPPQFQFFQPPPPPSILQYQAPPQTQIFQPPPPSSALQQTRVTPNAYHQQQPWPAWYGPPPYSAPQPYHTSPSTYQQPRSTQYPPPSPPLQTSSSSYVYRKQDPQSGYPIHPPTQQRNANPPYYGRAPVGVAPTPYAQSGPHAAVEHKNSHLAYDGYAVAPSPPLPSSVNSVSLTPLSAVASIKAVLQITGSVLFYLRDVKDGWSDYKKLVGELISTRGILDTLLDTFQNMEGPGTWVLTIALLGEREGLGLLRATLENLLDQLSRSASAPSYVKFTKSLPWPFATEEIQNVLKSIETEKSLLLMALQNDITFCVEINLRKKAAVLSGEGGNGAPQPPVVKPQTSTRQPESIMGNLTSSISRMRIDTRLAATTATAVLRQLDPTPQDRVEETIRNVLTQDLATARTDEMISPNHPCFNKSWEFVRKWRISRQAIDNHIKLACGNRRFPVLMLLNLSLDHDHLSFDAMV